MILVTGATGFVGRNIIRQLMADEMPVRALIARSRSANIPWDTTSEYAPEILIGDTLDDEVVFEAVTGVHTIIHLENAMWWGRAHHLERIELAGTRHLVSAARSARVGRILYLSHLGAAPSSAYTLMRIKGQVEEVVRSSGLAYTILRSGIIFGEEDAFINHIAMMFRMNPFFFYMPGQGEITLHPIYIDDLVKCVTHALESINAVDNVIEVGGQEYITFEDLLFTIMRLTGMRRLIIPIPPYVFRATTALARWFFWRRLMSPHWLDILATNRMTQLGNVYEHFGFQPRRIEDTLVTYLPHKKHLLDYGRYLLRRTPRGA